MNWSRTKSIFIVAFLILNSFLGYQLWEKMQTKQFELAQLSESSLEELLALRQITIDTELQAEQAKMSQLNAQFVMNLGELEKLERQNIIFQDHLLQSQFHEPIMLEPEWKLESFQQQVMDPYVLWSEQYRLDQWFADGIHFLQTVEGRPIFVGGLRFLVEQEEEGVQVLGYDQVYFQVVNTGTKQPIISSYTSIRTLLDNQAIPPYSTITGVELGYYGQIYEVESQVLTPAWRIMIETEESTRMIYVNAITGAIETEYTR